MGTFLRHIGSRLFIDTLQGVGHVRDTSTLLNAYILCCVGIIETYIKDFNERVTFKRKSYGID